MAAGSRQAARRGLLTGSAAVLAALAGGPGSSRAQPVEDTTPGLAEVVVSASRRAQLGFDAPASIQGIDARAIGLAGPRVNLSESLGRIPGVWAANRQNYAQDLQLAIRGFGARSTFGIRGVRLTVDGIPATMPDGQGQAATIDLGAAQRIEVLRGPLAQLYGNAAGGVVQVFSREPTGRAGAAAEVGFGGDGERRDRLDAEGRVGDVSVATAASDFSTSGYRAHGEARRHQYGLRLGWTAGPDTRLTLTAARFEQPLALDPLGLTRAQAAADPRQAVAIAFAQDPRKRVSQDQAGLVVEHRPDTDQTLSVRLHAGRRDLFNALAVPEEAQRAPTSSGGIVDLDRRFGGASLTWQAARRLATGRAEVTLGVEHERMDDRRLGFVNRGGQPGTLKRDEDDRVAATDVLALLEWHAEAPWSLTAGMRRSHVRFATVDRFIDVGNPDDSGRIDYSASVPAAGVTWHASDAVNVYAAVGRGFETPTFTELAYRPAGSGLNDALRAARSTHAELGVKVRPGPAQRLDLAVFASRTDAEIVVDTNVGGRTTYRNAGRTRRDGIEASWSATLSPGVAALVAATVIDARFVDGFAGSAGPVTAGNRIPGVPQRQVFAELSWRERGAAAREGWHAGVEANGAGRVWVDDRNSDAAGRWLVLNLRAGYGHRIGAWRLAAFGRIDNVADRAHFGSVIVNEAQGRFFEPAPGRRWTFGVTLAHGAD